MTTALSGDSARSELEYDTYPATGLASLAVSHYWTVRTTRCRVAVEAALPDTSLEVYFNLGDSGRYVVDHDPHRSTVKRTAWILAPRTDRLLVGKESVEYEVIGVRLRPGVVRQVLGPPASELARGMIDLSDFWGSAAQTIHDELIDAGDVRARIAVLDRELSRRLRRGARQRDAERSIALCRALGGTANEAISDIARRYGMTHRRLIAFFDHHVGLKPKSFDRIGRLRRVMRAVAPHRRLPWAAIAVHAGYHDQAHLIHEFRRLTGLTPTQYEASRLVFGEGLVCHRAASP